MSASTPLNALIERTHPERPVAMSLMQTRWQVVQLVDRSWSRRQAAPVLRGARKRGGAATAASEARLPMSREARVTLSKLYTQRDEGPRACGGERRSRRIRG